MRRLAVKFRDQHASSIQFFRRYDISFDPHYYKMSLHGRIKTHFYSLLKIGVSRGGYVTRPLKTISTDGSPLHPLLEIIFKKQKKKLAHRLLAGGHRACTRIRRAQAPHPSCLGLAGLRARHL